jgi:hypothetical protein
VYDTLEPTSEKPSRFGEHDLINVYTGFPSWEEQLLSAKPGGDGKTLVAGNPDYFTSKYTKS